MTEHTPYRLPFVGRLYLALAAAAVPVFAILLVSVWWNESRSLEEMLQRYGQSLTAGFAESARLGVQLGDRDFIRDSTSGVQAMPDVIRLDIYDAEGERLLVAKSSIPPLDLSLLVRAKDQGQSHARVGMNERFIDAIHAPDGKVAGYIVIDVSRANVRRALDGALMITVVVCLLLLLLFAMLTWLEVRRASRPLFEIDDAVARVTGGDLNVAVNEDVGEPFARVARGFNGMVRTLSLVQEEDRRKRRILQESERRFRELFMHLPVPMYIADMDGQLRECNPAMLNLFAYVSAKAMTKGGGFEERLFDSPEDYRRMREELLSSGRIAGREVRCISSRGELLHCLMHMSLMRDAANRPVGVEGMLQDVTQLRLLEQNLVQAQKMEALGQLAGGVAHDFNNLLTVIQANADWLEDETAGNEKLRPHAKRISDATGRATELTRNMLGFARKGEMRREAVAVFPLLQEVVMMFGETGDRRIRVSLRGDTAGRVLGDPGQLHQVFMNLCINAMQAMPQGGDLLFDVQCDPARVVIRVSDTGCGMSETVREHIFEPFFTTKEVGAGTGLGLAMVYGIVQKLGGSISVESVVGEGTTFEVLLPRLQEYDEHAVRVEKAATVPAPGLLSGTVLLVDDEQPLLEIGEKFLVREGLTVITAASGEEALQLLGGMQSLPDVILLDLNMPGMGGVETLSRIRQTYENQKVIVVSGYSETTLDGTVKDLLYDGFVSKPYKRKDLRHALACVLAG
ncbi:MAG: hypothetical protein COS82_07025 [Zetaproteobacteria bacterium CG06_land_8_20_14_3_00_59_53]|nr:MAG: hypothetical protein COS82_07025 [Zetaproteobacteria bacterium CG06_land_8_20_14_3_00_59_53]PJC17351.1 MAG: hypothetical protein CO062_07780 [Zetaproteobacteria bacterium CG_4_9_14_0_2_um_filter_59_191]HCS12303.1 hypothetical protein [Zetaproteobacteria bacterium]